MQKVLTIDNGNQVLKHIENLIRDEVNPSDLINILYYAKSIMGRESTEEDSRKKDREIIIENIELLRQETMKNLLKGRYKSNEAVNLEFERLGISYSFNSAVVVCFEIDEFASILGTGKVIDHNILKYITGILNTGSTAVICKIEDNIYACILSFNNINSERYYINKVFSDFSNIIEYIGNEYGMAISVGVSDLCSSLVKIPEYYKKSMTALKLKKFFKPGKILFYEHFKIPKDEMTIGEIKKIISQIYAEIYSQIDFRNIRGMLKEIFCYFRPDRISLETANQIVLELTLVFSLLTRKMEELFQNEYFLPVSLIQYGDFFEDFFELVEKRLKEYEKEIDEYGLFKKEVRWEIKETIDYIRKNYSKKVSLEEIAERIGMSRTYISKLFKKEMGVNFENYLLEYRMKIARELLKTSNLKIYEIAINLGFCSTQHFSHIFKKFQGMTPEAYKINPTSNYNDSLYAVSVGQ